jgi:predicted DNA-binding protein YlxM (UPF0122 family)
MRKDTIQLREQWIKEKWTEYKNRLSMQDLAEIFGVSVGNIYRIIKKQNNKKL